MLSPNFLLATPEKASLEVYGQWVERAKFGNHIRLNQLSITIDKSFKAGYAKGASKLIAKYFDLAGFNADELDGEYMLLAYGQIEELNRLMWHLPMQTWDSGEEEKPQKKYDYSGRYVAWIVHKIATQYGWTRHYIFNDLWPEEVFFYLQEIVISEYDKSDKERSLSELAYSYDKVTRKSKFIPTPRPDWMEDEVKKVTYKIPKSRLPMGHIIKLDDMVH